VAALSERLRLLPVSLAVVLAGSAALAVLLDETRATTFFAFDDVSIPYAQNVRLEMRQPKRHAANAVLRRGEARRADALGVLWVGGAGGRQVPDVVCGL
jgi:hypothetical protein